MNNEVSQGTMCKFNKNNNSFYNIDIKIVVITVFCILLFFVLLL